MRAKCRDVRERFMPHQIQRTDGPTRKVVVVGAGPGGCEAARVSAERGHEVVLFERSDAVGGQINLAAQAPQRDQMGGIVRWFDMELKRLGVDIRFNTDATADMIRAENPDIVVLATGGRPGIEEDPAGAAMRAWRSAAGTFCLAKLKSAKTYWSMTLWVSMRVQERLISAPTRAHASRL